MKMEQARMVLYPLSADDYRSLSSQLFQDRLGFMGFTELGLYVPQN